MRCCLKNPSARLGIRSRETALAGQPVRLTTVQLVALLR